MLNLYLLLITFQSYNVGESPHSNLTKEEILHRQKFKIKSRVNCLQIKLQPNTNYKMCTELSKTDKMINLPNKRQVINKKCIQPSILHSNIKCVELSKTERTIVQ